MRVSESAAFLERNRTGLLIGVLVFAAAIRLLRANEDALWLDETASVWFSAQSWAYLWYELPIHETNPPFYYMMLKIWTGLFGSSEFALRIPSVIASVAVVYFMWISGRLLGGSSRGWALGLAAALICSAWQFQIGHAANARGYAFSSLGVAMLMTGCLRLFAYSREVGKAPQLFGPEGLAWLPFVEIAVGSVLALWSHLLAVVTVALVSVVLFLWWAVRHRCDWKLFLSLLASAALIVALYCPYLLTFIALATGEHKELSGIAFLEKPTFRWLVGLSSQAFGQQSFALGDLQVPVDALLISIGFLGFWRVARASTSEGNWMVGLVVTMIVGLWVILVLVTYLLQPVLMSRSLIFAQPPLILMLACAPWAITRGRAILATAFLGFIVIGTLQPLSVILPGQRTFGTIVDLISESDAPGAPVVIVPYLVETGLLYYEEKKGVTLNRHPYPSEFQLPNQPIPRIDPETASKIVSSLDGAPTVWVLTRRLDEVDPDTNLYRGLENAGYRRSLVVHGEVIDWQETLSRFDREAGDQSQDELN